MNHNPKVNTLAKADHGVKKPATALLKNTFMITQGFLVLAVLVTLVGSIQSNEPKISLALGLETFIAAVASYYYSQFVNKFARADKIDPADITEIRYADWYITTPVMLFVLMLICGFDFNKTVHFLVLGFVVLLDYFMLYLGHLGELGRIDKLTACIGGFVPFILMFGLIYRNILMSNRSNKKDFFFGFFVIVWALYGVVYLFEDNTKNTLLNALDAVAKGGVGIGLYTHLL
jgi:bacteriorhodopsin